MTNTRSLPALLRAAERRVNAHVFKRPGDSTLASIPANKDRDVDMLLLEAADELERLLAIKAEWEKWYFIHLRACVDKPPKTFALEPSRKPTDDSTGAL